jgi:hypothetical protein
VPAVAVVAAVAVVVAAVALHGSRWSSGQADAVLVPAAERLALCYFVLWTEVVALQLTTLIRQGLNIVAITI